MPWQVDYLGLMKRLVPIACCCWLTSAPAQTWHQLQDFPGSPRDDAASFTIWDKVYVGTGMDVGFQLTNDWYAYTPFMDVWDTIAPLPASPRQYCASFTIGDHGYLFGGLDALGPLSDLWRYDPTTDSWEQRASLPASARYACAAFQWGGQGHVVSGMLAGGQPTSEHWCYDPLTDTWEQRAALPGVPRHRASAVDNLVIGGADSAYNALTDTYAYWNDQDTWSTLSSLPEGRYSADATDGVLLCGASNTTTVNSSSWSRAWFQDEWLTTTIDPFPPGGRRSAVTGNNWVLADIGVLFYGTGSDNVQRYNDWWMLVYATGVDEDATGSHPWLFPTLTDDRLTVRPPDRGSFELIITDQQGRVVMRDRIQDTTALDVSVLAPGSYYTLLRSSKGTQVRRFVVAH